MSEIPESVRTKYPDAELWTKDAIDGERRKANAVNDALIAEMAAEIRALREFRGMLITEADAAVILGMSEVCDNEGIGPDDTDLKKRLIAAFPNIKRGVY